MAEKFVDRVPTYPNRYKIIRANGSTEYITLERADEPVVEGTPLNAETLNGLVSGFSESAHTHTANEITSGVFTADRIPVVGMGKGGTGATDGATGLKNLFAAGITVLSPHQYGDTLPDPGTPGRIFFKKVTE